MDVIPNRREAPVRNLLSPGGRWRHVHAKVQNSPSGLLRSVHSVAAAIARETEINKWRREKSSADCSKKSDMGRNRRCVGTAGSNARPRKKSRFLTAASRRFGMTSGNLYGIRDILCRDPALSEVEGSVRPTRASGPHRRPTFYLWLGTQCDSMSAWVALKAAGSCQTASPLQIPE